MATRRSSRRASVSLSRDQNALQLRSHNVKPSSRRGRKRALSTENEDKESSKTASKRKRRSKENAGVAKTPVVKAKVSARTEQKKREAIAAKARRQRVAEARAKKKLKKEEEKVNRTTATRATRASRRVRGQLCHTEQEPLRSRKKTSREKTTTKSKFPPMPSSMKELKKHVNMLRKQILDQDQILATADAKQAKILADAGEKEKSSATVLNELKESNKEEKRLREEAEAMAEEARAAEAEARRLQKEAKSELLALQTRVNELESFIVTEKRERAAEAKAASDIESDLRAKLASAEILRRQLHNTIQELKGNIRVFCRVRPIVENENKGDTFHSEIDADDVKVLSFPSNDPDGKELVLSAAKEASAIGGKSERKTWRFGFDKVLKPESSQEEVFDEIEQLVQSTLDGYNVCIFAYGQTGSGKTFTMEGEDGDLRGVIPRSVDRIFEGAKELEEQNWKFVLKCSHLEVYNESLRDLLVGHKMKQKKGKERRKSMGVLQKSGETPLKIRHDHRNDTTHVSGLTEITVSTPDDVKALIQTARKNRATASTKCNAQSSRSHSIFQLRLEGIRDGEERHSTLNLVDLAGSERLSKSKASGDRLKETQAINKSLSALGDCIFALANQDRHVPFRNSTLTWLLKNAISKNSKVLMFVNISPIKGSIGETLNSLRFAQKVNSCDIKTAKRNTKKKLTRSKSAGRI
eukprot:g3741.t1